MHSNPFFSKKNIFAIGCLTMMILGCIVGFNFLSQKMSLNKGISNREINIFSLLIQNYFFAIAIIIGSFTFNILTVCCCTYNGVVFGMYLKSSYVNLGLEKTINLFLPHTLIEIIWMTLAIKLSFEIYSNFRKYVFHSNRFTRFGLSILKLKNKMIIIFLLITLGCFVEYFITYKLLLK